MNHKVLSVFLSIFLLISIVPTSVPAFGAIASIQATNSFDDEDSDGSGGTFDELSGITSVTTVKIGSTTYALATGFTDSGVQIIDISTPSSPTDVASFDDGDSDGSGGTFDELSGAFDVTTVTIGSSTYALVLGQNDDGVQIIDISTPSSPTDVASFDDGDSDGSGGTFDELDGVWDIDTVTIGSNTYALVTATVDDGIQIIDISTPSSPTDVASITDGDTDGSGGTFDELDGARGLDIFTIGSSTYAIVASSADNGVQIIDISTPSSPTDVASFDDGDSDGQGGTFTELDVPVDITTVTIGSGTYALVTDSNAVQIIDISTPSSPLATSSISDTATLELGQGYGITTAKIGDKTYAFVVTLSDDGLQILNISNPSNPLPVFARSDGVGSFDELNGARGVTTVTISSTTYVLVAAQTDNGIQIVTLKEIVTDADTGEFLQLINDRDGIGGAFDMEMLGVNSTNHIFVADEGNHSIRKFNSTGIFLSALGTPGSSGSTSSTFNLPHSVVHDSNDRVIVVDTQNDRVQVFTSTGTAATLTIDGDETGATSFDFPHDADVDSSNNIYIVDRDAGTGIVQKYSSTGTHQLTLTGAETGATDFDEPLGVAIDSNDRIIVTQRGGSTDGFQIFDSSGNFVKRVTTAATSGDTVFDNPHDVAVDSSDRIYIADQNNNRIQIFDSSGTFVQSITTGVSALSSPSSVAIDSNGRIVVADQGNLQVVVFEGFGVKIADTEGSSKTVIVDNAGGSANVQYSETEGAETETISLSITLPSATSGSVTVETVDEDTVEQGVQLATATDITAPCTDTCTVQFTVPNDVLTAAGLSSSSASIYHDSDGDEILQANEAITTTRDTTTTPGSTIFSGDASFTSKFAVGGVVGTTAQATAGAAAAFGLFGLFNTCDEDGFGQGQSLMVYDIMYDKCTEGQVKVYADTTCGPMTVKIGDPFGISIAGMSSNQPLLNNDTKKVIYNHPIESDMEWFSVIITDKKDEFTDKIYTNQCTGTMSFTGNTGYTSEQQGTNSPSEDTITESTIPKSKLILPGNVVEVIPTTPDTIDEIFAATLQVDPEPIIPELDSFSPELMIDPEPQELEMDPEPEDASLWLQSIVDWFELFIR